MPQVYSYLRFSSIKQSAGTSIDRQIDYAQKWAASKGMVLDESLSMRDEGLSAYHQRHVKRGALGAFLVAIDAGKIPPGSVLVVEGLDRLSRAEPILAQAQLSQIINAEITVVTASDGKEYNRERLKSNPMDLVYSLLVMIRAHEESETKSKRAKAAIRKHCEAWSDKGSFGSRRFGRHPQWLTFENGTWEFVPARVEAIRHMISMFRRGLGHVRIADDLMQSGRRMTDGLPNSNQIYRIIRNEALKGVKTVNLDGDAYELKGYYPAILSDGEFAELQTMMEQRANSGGASIKKIPGIMTGIGITYCGYCGGRMVASNITTRARPDGSLADGNRRIICATYATKKPCPSHSNCSIVPIERAIMNYCSNQMNLEALLDGGDRQAPAKAKLEKARADIEDIEKKLARVTDAMIEADDGATPITFIRKARELEAQLAKAKADASSAEREIIAASQETSPAMADAWAALINGVAKLDQDARLMARKLVSDTFEKIVVYNNGFMPGQESATIDLLLIARGGGTRMLSINRKSGEWQASEDAFGTGGQEFSDYFAKGP